MQSNDKRRIVWLTALALCILGAWVSWHLSQRHLQQGFGAGSFLGQMCQEDKAACDQVIKSRWGTVLGTPTAVWGLTYFTVVGLWLLLVGLPNRAGRWWQVLPILGTLAGLVIAAALDYVMFVKLPVWCPLCFITHVTSLLLFVAAILMWPRQPKPALSADNQQKPAKAPLPAPTASPRAGRVLLAAITVLIAAAAVHENFQHRRYRAEFKAAGEKFDEAQIAAVTGTATTAPAGDCTEVRAALNECQNRLKPFTEDWQALVDEFQREPIITLGIRPDDPSKGNPRARRTVVVFSDFECPRCLDFTSYWLTQIEPYAMDKVRLVFRYFPMNTNCNPAIHKTLYAKSCESAAAAEAARLQGGNEAFWKMHDELFKNQLRKTRLSYTEMAKLVGLDPVRLEKDMASPQVRDRIQQDIAFGQQAQVNGTPTVFMNGRIINVWGRDRLWQYLLQFAPRSKPTTAHTATQPAAAR